MFDQQNCFVFKDDLAKAAGLSPQQVHEIAVIVDDQNNNLVQTEQRLKAAFPKESVLNWRKLSPDAGLVDDFLTVYYIGIMVIIYLALAFGIINTMMMAVLERMKELGMLMAIGMRKRWVFLMIMLETIFLTFIGAIIGMVAGYLLIVWTGRTGLNFSSVAEGYEAIGWASVVYPSITFHFFIQIVVLVVIVAILSSIMPARKVLKIPVIEILKTE
jgi:ABC-type lipoprotein release transport system permease subunit